MEKIDSLLKQLLLSNDNLKEYTDQIFKKEYQGSTAAGMVVVVIDGKYEMKSIRIDPEILQMEREVVEDLIRDGYNDARRRVAEDIGEGVEGLLGRLGVFANSEDATSK